MLTKSARYGTVDGTSWREERVDRLKIQARSHVLMLNDAAVLTRPWFEMAENMVALGRFAVIESAAPVQIEKNVNAQAGRKQTGTLWDQERDEISVRVLLEEGKLNLGLRILQNYMQMVMQPDLIQPAIKRFAIEVGLTDAKVVEVCRDFEIALGQLLRAALCHVEVMQILDIPCLVQHCRDILQHGIDAESVGRLGDHLDGMQDSTVVYYLNSLAQHMEQLDEERILEILDSNQILLLMPIYIAKHRSYLSTADTNEAIQFLVAVFNCESFTSNADRYETDDVMKALVDIKGHILEPALSTAKEVDFRRDLRRFLDRINAFQRRTRYCAPSSESTSPQLN